MAKFRRVYALLVLGAILVPISVVVEGNPAPEKRLAIGGQWGEPVNGQAISISAEKKTYTAGERILLNVRIKNIGSTEVPHHISLPLDYELTVLLVESRDLRAVDRHGTRVVPADGRVPHTLQGRLVLESLATGGAFGGRLDPERERCTEIDVTRLFDMTIEGKYTVTARRTVFKSHDEPNPLEATSNTLGIVVTDAPYFRRVRTTENDTTPPKPKPAEAW